MAAASLTVHLSKTHKDRHSRFFHLDFPSEYALPGYAARELENYSGHDVGETPQQEWCYNIKERSNLGSYLKLYRQESVKRTFLLIHSNLGISAVEYISIIKA
jgi:hypothetical protein